jgi:hypothetical protein
MQRKILGNVTLLKARILNDGGLNQQAIQVLQGKSTSSFSKKKNNWSLRIELEELTTIWVKMKMPLLFT